MKTIRLPLAAVGGIVLVIGMAWLFWHCDRHEAIVGNYRSVGAESQAKPPATLALQTNGKGIWSTDTDNAPFRWRLDRNVIRLHTQAGGIIQGVIDGEHIRIDMPGTGTIVFERQD